MKESVRTLQAYIHGFVACLTLTTAAFFAVQLHLNNGLLTRGWLSLIIAVCAVIQCLVQLFCFLHIRHEAKPRWKVLVLIFMVSIVVIVVAGSIWIMDNLNYHMNTMTPQQVQTYMRSNEGL